MKERIIIITGGNSGLGYEIAKILCEKNENICIIGRSKEKNKKVYNNLSKISNKSIEIYTGSVADEEFVKNMYQELNEKYSIDMLFNVAGIGMQLLPQHATKEMVNDVFEANLVGMIVMSSNALKYMIEQDKGSIVNILSSAAKKGNPNESIYCAAKWGARGYTESLKQWAKDTNIRVCGVYPGGMNTPFWDNIGGGKNNVLNFMNPEEVAQQIVFSVMDKTTIKVTDIDINRL